MKGNNIKTYNRENFVNKGQNALSKEKSLSKLQRYFDKNLVKKKHKEMVA